MTVRELRQKYLHYFQSKGHDIYPSGSLVPYDVTGRLDESLLFNGAGMVQFKPFFRGLEQPPNKRLTSAQKCVRTGDIDSVGDSSHLTFFEMLGNFSFGDYFKREAIMFSWEFLTSTEFLGIDPHRLAFTVFEEDDEAYQIWSECVSSVGIEPQTRIFRLGEETNYWPAGAFSSGPPGPCGPNTEMFYWVESDTAPSGPYNTADFQQDEGDGKWLEIWNDVFIQYEWKGVLKNPDRPNEGYIKEKLAPLPFCSVDTGMGVERTTAILSGKKSVYDTDAFTHIITLITKISPIKPIYGQSEPTDRAVRIIADHIRTACFCIADGILPSNSGRGYVLRRLIRRAVLKGQRVLGFNEPFFHLVYQGVAEAMADHYPELIERREVIVETLQSEETLFRRTLSSGYALLESQIELLRKNRQDRLDGEYAFRLYDTYGFPLEVTIELCEESGIAVDVEGYERAMLEAQERSRGATGMDTVYGGVVIRFDFTKQVTDERATPTHFEGYKTSKTISRIVGALPELDETGAGTGRIAVALDRTPFYAESGGQVSDTGIIISNEFELRVIDVIKQDGVFVHLAEPTRIQHPDALAGMSGDQLADVLYHQLFDHEVEAAIDLPRRLNIMRNHTATHLLHAALRSILGKHVTQAGSLVGPDYLRFDFTHGKAMSDEEIAEVETRVYSHVLQNMPVVTYADIPLSEAKARGAMALFGEKYGEQVRMVEIDEVSRELCGGTHVSATGEIGLFKVISETSAASGIRRIEAVTGEGAYLWINDQLTTIRQASTALKTNPKELLQTITKTLEQLKEERRKREKLAAHGASATESHVVSIGSVEWVEQVLIDAEPKEANLVADRLVDGKPNRVALVTLKFSDKLTFVCKVGSDAMKKGAHAGNILKEAARIAGGGGGGRPDFATAGGRDPEKLAEALEGARNALEKALG